MKENNTDKDFIIDEELLERNLSLSPDKRLKLMEEMREFFWVNIPKETKELWEELKHLKLEELD